jgi:4-amino-4-deoxy-L-arabinose transferase-like glycosyltransferase
MIPVVSAKRMPSFLSIRKKEMILFLFILLGIALLWAWGANTNSFNRRDAYDYAQISVELFEGNGLSTLQLLPRHIIFLQEKGLLENRTWPNLSRNPLLMITNLFFQRVFPNVIQALVAQSGFWYLASIPLLFLLVLRFTDLKIAAGTVVFYAADPEILLYSYSGMTETLAIFLLLALFVIAFSLESKPLKWVLLGGTAALAYLARAQFLILLPWVLLSPWLIGTKNRRTSSALLVLAGMLILLLPWMSRNYTLTGDPLFSFNTSRNLVKGTLPGQVDLELRLHAPVDVDLVVRQYRDVILHKFVGNLKNFFSPAYWGNNFRGMLVLFPGLFFFSLVRREDRGEYDRLKWNVALLFLLTFILISLTVDSVRYYLLFRPLILAIAFGELYFLILSRSGGSSLLIKGVILLILGIGVTRLVVNVYQYTNLPPVQSRFALRTYESLRDKTSRETLVASDISERVSVFVGTRTLRLPADPQELLEINREYLPVDYVLFSRELSQAGLAGEEAEDEAGLYRDYLDFVDEPAFLEQFSFDEKLPNGELLFKRKSGNE